MMKALLAAASLALSIGQAGAVCLSHSPYDPRCTVQDMLDPTAANPQFYMQNPIVRQTRIRQCTAPVWPEVRPPASWCAAAFAAQRFVSGAQYGGHP